MKREHKTVIFQDDAGAVFAVHMFLDMVQAALDCFGHGVRVIGIID